jgi:hypothetical protein
VEQVRTWSGQAYDAIVLAGDGDGIVAAEVYQGNGAKYGMIDKTTYEFNHALLANTREIEIARVQLEKGSLCVSKSFAENEYERETTLEMLKYSDRVTCGDIRCCRIVRLQRRNERTQQV